MQARFYFSNITPVLREQSLDRHDRLVVVAYCFNTYAVRFIHSVYYLIVSDVDPDMAVIADQISCPGIFQRRDLDAIVSLCMRVVRKADPEMLENGKYEP